MTNSHSIRQISRLVWQGIKANRLQALNNLVAGLLIVGLEFLFVWLTKQTIDIATHQSHIMPFRTAVTFLVGTLLLQLVIRAWRSWINAMLSIKAGNRMQMDMFAHTLRTPWADLMAFHSGDIINRIEKDVNVIVSLVTDTLPSFIIVCAQFCGAFAFLYIMDSTLALFVVIIIPFFLVIGKLYVKKMRKLTRQIRDADSFLQSQYQEGITNRIVIKTIRGATNVIIRRVQETQNKIVSLVHYRARFSVSSNTIMNFGFATAYLFTFIWGTYHLSIGVITYGALIAFVQLVGQIQRPARSLVMFIPDFINALTSGERILQIKQLEEEKIEAEDNQTAPANSSEHSDNSEYSENSEYSDSSDKQSPIAPLGVRIEHVSFCYKTGRPILHDFSYDFMPGSRVAIMGPTGRGKTTLIRLMLALLRPQSGRINVYGKGFNHIVDVSTRPMFAYVPQGNTLFSGSIRSNLLIAAPKANDDQLWQALRMAKADFVERLPEGLSSPCGEKGVALSEGQAQRLCIARALLVEAPILLLDEATSALDKDTEAAVLKNITSALPNTTIICISHRERVLEYCPTVLRLDNKA